MAHVVRPGPSPRTARPNARAVSAYDASFSPRSVSDLLQTSHLTRRRSSDRKKLDSSPTPTTRSYRRRERRSAEGRGRAPPWRSRRSSWPTPSSRWTVRTPTSPLLPPPASDRNSLVISLAISADIYGGSLCLLSGAVIALVLLYQWWWDGLGCSTYWI